MEARVLAHTYVVMDRNVFDQLLCSSLLPELFERVKGFGPNPVEK